MHNNIMAAGSRDRPYTPTTIVVPAVPATDDSPAVPEHTTIETPMNMSPENKAHEMWEAIERLQQGESLNIQDFWSQRTVNVAGARENVGSLVVQQTRIQCFNYKEFGHFAKECRKPKGVKDSTYHKETYCCANKLSKVQNDTGYNVFANELQHFEQSESINNTCLVKIDDSNVIPDSPDMCDNDIQNDQNDVECEEEHDALANLIANLKFDVDENKKIQKQLKKANTSLAHELEQCQSILAETSKTLKESNIV
uniref:CCHC-type domain-containing protein n=1 Tax=Tanacetum cinerariifolium TaxID=118510 RepID=A0A6L2JDR0_TANCI|nr:hypothetical protein [Tanacetum cinerariifolium]